MSQGQLLHNELLARFTSWRIGGVADQLYKPSSIEALSAFLKQLPLSEKITFLGLGSNVLIRDGGIRGTVILTQGLLNQIELTSNYQIRAEAGLACPTVARFCARHDLANAEFLAGIPGTIGGALAMNAGAFGSEIWEKVIRVMTIDRMGKIHYRTPQEYLVQYRHVQAKTHDLSTEWFIAGYFQFEAGNKEVSLNKIRNLLDKRSATQPTGEFSCGSVFRNPSGDYAARLIEQCGLKGMRVGGAVVSEKHANFIINENSATASDVEQLIDLVAEQVKKTTGVILQREVHVIGEAKQKVFTHDVTQLGRVAILTGGTGSERAISLESGQLIFEATQRLGINSVLIDIKTNEKTAIIKQLTSHEIDRVFIVIHGVLGEDGFMQSILDELNLSYVGSDSSSSARAFDKVKTKKICQEKNIPVLEYRVAKSLSDLEEAAKQLGYPLAVKPVSEGSSVGVSKVTEESELKQAFEKAVKYDQSILVEPWISGKEYTVGIVGDQLLPPIEIIPKRAFYDFDAKYTDNATEFRCPASSLSSEQVQEVQKIAQEAYLALGCSGWGRADLIQDSDDRFWLFEVNTIPGMTSHSLLPLAAKAHGMSYDELIFVLLSTGLPPNL